jgi:hypothetical protein
MLPFHSAGRNTNELSNRVDTIRRIHAILPSQTAAVQFLMNSKDGTVSRMLPARPWQCAISIPVLGPVFTVRSSVPLTRGIPFQYTLTANPSPNGTSSVHAFSLEFLHEREFLAVTASSCLVATSCSLPC